MTMLLPLKQHPMKSLPSNSTMGGDSSAVKSNLKDVTNIYSNTQAFAVIKNDGSVVTWGNTDAGGDSTSVASDLNEDNAKDVTKIASTQNSCCSS